MDSKRAPLNPERIARTRHKVSPSTAAVQTGESAPPRRRLPPHAATDLLVTHRPETHRRPSHRPHERGPAPLEEVASRHSDASDYRTRPYPIADDVLPANVRLENTPARSDSPTRPESFESHAPEEETEPPRRRPRRSRSMFARKARRVGAQVGGPNLKRRPRRALWRSARRGVMVLLGVAVVEVAAVALTGAQSRVTAVDVQGLNATSPDSVHRRADRLIGENWLLARTRPVTAALKAMPTVRDAQIVRTLTWPPRLTVRVQERVPYARVGVHGKWWVVDDTGVPFRLAGAQDADLNAVTGPAFSPKLGKALPGQTWKPVVEFTNMLADPAQAGGRWALRRIYFDRDGYASLRIVGGAGDTILVRLGNGQWPEKLARARTTLAYFESTGRHAQALNLISYNRPTWTPRRALSDQSSHAARAPASQGGDSDTASGQGSASGEAADTRAAAAAELSATADPSAIDRVGSVARNDSPTGGAAKGTRLGASRIDFGPEFA